MTLKSYWFVLPLFVLASVVVSLYTADLLLKEKDPTFFTAPATPGVFCKTLFRGITLPPAGIFICADHFNDEKLRAHELVHWDQYQRSSSFSFYITYVWGWARAGFNYANNPMEIEARERTHEFMK